MSNTIELPKEIEAKIDSESIDYAYKVRYKDEPTGQMEKAFIAGATAWAQKAIGFAEWVDKDYCQCSKTSVTPNLWYKIGEIDKGRFTTESLFIEYLKTLPQ